MTMKLGKLTFGAFCLLMLSYAWKITLLILIIAIPTILIIRIYNIQKNKRWDKWD